MGLDTLETHLFHLSFYVPRQTMDLSNYDLVADWLINHHSLIVGDEKWQLSDIEIYDRHQKFDDEYVHSHPHQATYGNWYFHRTGTREGCKYKGGTYKGLDVTLGNDGRYYGVLIRGIRNDTEVVDGPCLVVNRILSILGKGSILDLTNDSLPKAFENDVGLHLVEDSHDLAIMKGPRFGLSDKYPQFKDLKMRYVVVNGKGRPVTKKGAKTLTSKL